jgi:hypothetical protein
MTFEPQRASRNNWIDSFTTPPRSFVPRAVDLAMVTATEWNSEFVAGLACHRSALRETEMMGVRRVTPAYQARLLCHKLDVFAITHAARFRQLQRTFIYPLRSGSLPWLGRRDGRGQSVSIAIRGARQPMILPRS